MFQNRALIKYQISQSVITDQIVLWKIHTIFAFELILWIEIVMKLKGFRDHNDMPTLVESCKICLCCRQTGAWPSFLQKSYVLRKCVQKKKCRRFVLVYKNGFNFAVQRIVLAYAPCSQRKSWKLRNWGFSIQSGRLRYLSRLQRSWVLI